MNISFGRAIKVKSSTYFDRRTFHYYKDRVEPPVQALVDSINEKSSFYDRGTSQQIRDFLAANIKDYNGYDPVAVAKINYENYIFTGKDAKQVNSLQEKTDKTLKELDENFSKESKDVGIKDENEIKHRQSILKRIIENTRDSEIKELVEKDKRKNPQIGLELNISYDKKGGSISCTRIGTDIHNRLHRKIREIEF